MPPLPDLRDEAKRLLRAADERGLTIRAIGGVAVGLRCPSATRQYKDLDVVCLSQQRRDVDAFFVEHGYVADAEFNLLQGHRRLLHFDRANDRRLDTFVDRFEMCHALDLRDRLALDELTLTPADLLLTKLQVVETGERDLQDMVALLLDAEIDDERVAQVCADDWGWWRTATETLDKLERYEPSLAPQIAQLRKRIEAAPKSLRWRARAKIGDRVRWYELPEDD
jgi:hypothetical protein